ncbi:fungal-specific transcription factor domain-containing protein [Rhizoctonia solani]|nr:fungal-specific transcription factor domain-containing protein [Rhizoctonia solani]
MLDQEFRSPEKRPVVRRSKAGCLTCRKKRKKCDETWPVCSRCDRTVSSCIWPTLPPGLDPSIDILASSNTLLAPELDYMATQNYTENLISTHSHMGGLTSLDTNSSIRNYSPPSRSVNTVLGGSLGGASSWRGATCSGVSSSYRAAFEPPITKSLAARMWEYAHDLGPRIIWPPEGCVNCEELDPEGVAPTFRQSITAWTQMIPIEPVFQDVFHFYSTFLSRLFYNYALPSDAIVKWTLRKFNTSNSAKYGMLCMAGLFMSDYERSMMARSRRDGIREVYALALGYLAQDLEDARLTPWEKLTGLIPIMDYEFHTGQISKYFAHVTKALPLVKAVIGGDTIDLLNLRGEQMFDVNMWAWCDILDSMATSTPTRLKYESDLERAAQPGTEESAASQDKGIEWIYGIPNVMAVLLARTSALRHSSLTEQEKISKGAEIEQMARNWKIRPLEAKDCRLRIARVGAQEIWRHTAILYVHQTVFKSCSSHPIVKDSVKNIIKLASTLEPGCNPDSFLYLPYFISAFYATSPRDRYTMRSRLINCGNAIFVRNLARYLDELWKEADSAGRLTGWSEKKPPRIAF